MKNENMFVPKNLYPKVHSTIIHNRKKWKQPKCPTVNEPIIKMFAHPYNGMLFGHEMNEALICV